MSLINIDDINIYELSKDDERRAYKTQHTIDIVSFTRSRPKNSNINTSSSLSLSDKIPTYDDIQAYSLNFNIDTTEIISLDDNFIYKDIGNNVIIKFTQPERQKIVSTLIDQDEIPHEVAVGTYINNIRKEIPNFSCIIDWGKRQCPYNISNTTVTNCRYIVYEYIPGPTWESWLRYTNINSFLNCYLQILLSLKVAGRLYDFTHYDLHTNNIILRPVTQNDVTNTVGDTNTDNSIKIKYDNYTLETNTIAVFIDYGSAHIKTNTQHLGKALYSKFGIYSNRSFWIFDTFKLLMFSGYYTSFQYNKDLHEGKLQTYTNLITKVKGEAEEIFARIRIRVNQNRHDSSPKNSSLILNMTKKEKDEMYSIHKRIKRLEQEKERVQEDNFWPENMQETNKGIIRLLSFFVSGINIDYVLDYKKKKQYFECYPTEINENTIIDDFIEFITNNFNIDFLTKTESRNEKKENYGGDTKNDESSGQSSS